MTVRLFWLLLFSAVLFGAQNLDIKIKQTSKQLNGFSKDYKRLNRKMAKTAEAILKQKKQIAKQEQTIRQLEKELAEKSSSYKESKKQLNSLKTKHRSLKKKESELEQELVFAIAKSVSLSVLLDKGFAKNTDSIIDLEILKAKLKFYKANIKKFNAEYFQVATTIEQLSKQAKTLQNSIMHIDNKRKKLVAMQKKNKRDLKNLKIAKASYKKALKKLLKKQDELKKTLARLNIIKIDQERRKKEEQKRKQAFASTNVDTKNLPKVKRYGKSYQNIKTKRYTGPKTISPLDRYTVTKKYGTYTDPIYGIKVFNESISLKPKRSNAKVRNIFNGKVVYADKTALLNNIVIVEHKNGLHTIYANLSKIAPNIRKGKRIKKGYTIGRVSDELIFEATQRSFHIDPLKLFKN